jgi:protein-S-isoprenylcysteine O-methyltransferase Ste14
MIKTIVNWAKREHTLGNRMLAAIPAGFLFVVAIPWLLIRGFPRLDDLLGFTAFKPGVTGLIVSGILVLIGVPIAVWTVIDQYTRARGTPLPVMATQRLLTDGPYALSRNPMVFGTLNAYLGLCLLSGSWSSIIINLIFSLLLLGYLKLVEERELAARFGQAYLDYKGRTSFLIPWPRKQS